MLGERSYPSDCGGRLIGVWVGADLALRRLYRVAVRVCLGGALAFSLVLVLVLLVGT